MEWFHFLETAQLGSNAILIGAVYLLYQKLEKAEIRYVKLLQSKDDAMKETISILRELAKHGNVQN